jgi:ergothioneine biosynthesis protein EgtB
MISRAELKTRFLDERIVMEKLCARLSHEDCMVSSTAETSPPKWHLAHTTWFYEHFVLCPYAKNYEVHDSRFEYLFNSYYQTIGKFLPKSKRSFISRPSVEEVLAYRARVTAQLASLMNEAPEALFTILRPLIELGIHHEQQHQELLLMDIKQNFFLHPMKPTYLPANPHQSTSNEKAPVQKWFAFDGGLTHLGTNSQDFHYDNESGQHRVFLEPFRLSSHRVTNGEYLEFIKTGAYSDPIYWLSDGWDWIQNDQIKHPHYWIADGESFAEMTLSGVKPLELTEPVSHVSYYEAQAFATFKNSRLPTEAEWEHAASTHAIGGNFLEDSSLHPHLTFSRDASTDLHGGLWEWTQSAYLPYPGYKAFDQGLSEYNSKFMCNQFVLRGGSCVTPRSHYRSTYRNFYYPQMRWQFSGFRLAKDGL